MNRTDAIAYINTLAHLAGQLCQDDTERATCSCAAVEALRALGVSDEEMS